MASSTLTLESLGHDILVNGVFPYLSKNDIDQLKKVSPILNEYTNDPAVWHDLYYKTFGKQPNPFTIYDWPEMYRWRSKAGLYTWGESSFERLGYAARYLPSSELVPGRSVPGVCVPHPVESLTNMSISDLVCGGYWSAILSADGDIYGIGELDDYLHIPIIPLNPDHDLLPTPPLTHSSAGFNFGRRIVGLWPGRFGGRVPQPNPQLFGVDQQIPPPPTGGPALIDGHRPRITPSITHPPAGPADATADLITPEDQARNDQLNNTTSSIVLPNAENFPDLFGSTSGPEVQNQPRYMDYDEDQTPPKRRSSKLLKVLSNRKVKFVDLGGGGRTHLIGLDENYDVWVWDRAFFLPGIKLEFSFNSGLSKNHNILRIQSSWNCNFILVENMGLMCWYMKYEQPVAKTQQELDSWKTEEKSVHIEPFLVPHTDAPKESKDHVVDFYAGAGFLVYATQEGKLYKVSTKNRQAVQTESRIELTTVTNKLQELAIESQKNGNIKHKNRNFETDPVKVVRVRGGFQLIGVISDTDNVVCFDGSDNSPLGASGIQAHAEIQDKGCISVSVGDRHILALLKGGKLMSWGCESGKSGCLGLGPSVYTPEVLSSYDFNVSKPTLVQASGKVLAIAAGGWQSSAIITTEKIEN